MNSLEGVAPTRHLCQFVSGCIRAKGFHGLCSFKNHRSSVGKLVGCLVEAYDWAVDVCQTCLNDLVACFSG